MAATLYDTIQQNLTKPQPAPGVTDQTAQARKLLAATSGKAGGAPAPSSNVGEQAANDTTRQNLAQVQQQGQMAAAGIQQAQKQVEATEQTQRGALSINEQAAIQHANQQKTQILQELGQSGQQLDADRDRAKLEQLTQAMALNDKRYVDTLDLEGSKLRLDSDLAFKTELQKSILGSNTDLLKQQLQADDISQASSRDWQKVLASIDINQAITLANNAAKDAATASQIGAAQKIIQTGADVYSRTPSTTPSSAPTGNVSQSSSANVPGSSAPNIGQV